MPKCLIDGKEVEFTAGQNLIEVAKAAGIEIPVFCYHPGLSVVAQCRMCAVEIEKMPKIQTACSTPAQEGMVVRTNSERVKKQQKAVMEFLLINHPLDCPICDKAGECDLQEYSFKFGEAFSRYTEERRAYADHDMGPVIRKNMNRCIHCTRCIRFGEEVAGLREMVALRRGHRTEIATAEGQPLQTKYAGNYSDLCPTGSLTLKDFRYKSRSWLLEKVATICEGCSRGCHVELHKADHKIFRCVARPRADVNRYWICDEGRFNFHYVHHAERVVQPRVRRPTGLQECSWEEAAERASQWLRVKKPFFLAGNDLTQEELSEVKSFVEKFFPQAVVFHFGTPGVLTLAEDGDADSILKRRSCTSNLHGAEKLGLKPFRSIPDGVDGVVLFRGGRAVMPDLRGLAGLYIGVFGQAGTDCADIVLPGVSFAEKEGTVLNFQGKEQRFKQVIQAQGQALPIKQILEQLERQHGRV